MKTRYFFTLVSITLSFFAKAQKKEFISNPCLDSALFYVEFYVDDVIQNKPYEIYFLDSTNQIIRPQIYCDTCTPKLYIKPDNYICDSCSRNLLNFVYKNDEYEIEIERLWLNRLFLDMELGVITEPQKLVKCFSKNDLKEEKSNLKKQKGLTVNDKIGCYLYDYCHYYTPMERHCFLLKKIGRRTKQIQYAHVGRCDSIGPNDYYNYIGNKQTSEKSWSRYWKARFIWYFR